MRSSKGSGYTITMSDYAFIDLNASQPDETAAMAHKLKDVAIRKIMDELVAERERQGLTQREVGELSGMQTPNITRIESRSHVPSIEVLERYALVLGKAVRLELVDVEELKNS